jgi:hypothetical protein
MVQISPRERVNHLFYAKLRDAMIRELLSLSGVNDDVRLPQAIFLRYNLVYDTGIYCTLSKRRSHTLEKTWQVYTSSRLMSRDLAMANKPISLSGRLQVCSGQGPSARLR